MTKLFPCTEPGCKHPPFRRPAERGRHRLWAHGIQGTSTGAKAARAATAKRRAEREAAKQAASTAPKRHSPFDYDDIKAPIEHSRKPAINIALNYCPRCGLDIQTLITAMLVTARKQKGVP